MGAGEEQGRHRAVLGGGVGADGPGADLYMKKVNIQSGKQPWVSHHHWDSKAFNRNTHSLCLVNKARFSLCADLNSAFSSLGKPASHSSWETAGGLGGWVGLGCLLFGFGTFAVQKATFTSLHGLRANGWGGHSHSCPDREREAQRCKSTCPRSHITSGLSQDTPSLLL